ncbi:MAG: alcohol dehydrogenase catalytic domain-containing protein, partial [Anaerolineae bacterium]|nr:alcohol dehydrogenase catalytic domain-containing protein [Anaerolineae bacterium]
MKAIVYTEYGSPDVLQLKEIAKPAPKDNEILIKVHATSLSVGEVWARNFKAISPSKFSMPFPFWLPARMFFGFTKPKVNILGSEFSGVIEAIGKDVKNFKVGDQVFGYRGQNMGANAEYLC